MTHSREELASFQDGETRLIFARHRLTGALVTLEDGQADAMRSLTRDDLTCPLPDCAAPRLTTVGRVRGRDGFRHFRADDGGHGPESLFHWQASELVNRWLGARYPRSRVQKEERSNSAGERRADVMITAPTGQRIAFEIQYSPLTPAAWDRRHQSYKDQGIVDVWLFGHTGPQLRPAARRGGRVTLNPTHEAVVEAGVPLLWVNPVTRQIATAVTDRLIGANGRIAEVMAEAGDGRLTLHALDDFQLDVELGVTSEHLHRLAANRAAADAFQQAADEASQAADRRQAEVDARHESVLARRRAQVDAAAAAGEPAWLSSPLHAQILAAHDGAWPAHLDVPTIKGLGIPLPRRQWQATLFTQLIAGQALGSRVSSEAGVRLLAVTKVSAPECQEVVREWLHALVDVGWIRITRPLGRKRGFSFAVSRPPGRATATTGACVVCRLPLNPWDVGMRHSVCAPGWRA